MRTLVLSAFLLFSLAAPALADGASVERGAYIARLGDCTGCHTAPGGGEYGGGLPISALFGKIYSSNITPDKAYGIGNYSLNDFSRAVRQGIAKDGHHLYPAMPYPSYAGMTDRDVADLYAYFMHGVKPVARRPPETKLVFPFSQRWGLVFWNALFSVHGRFEPDPAHDDQWNRGAYLAQTVGHCGACHTPRGPFYQEKTYKPDSSDYLAGMTLDRWHTANLRGDPASGLGRWSEADIVAFLRTGRQKPEGGGAAAFGSMRDVVRNSTQYMRDEDLRALAAYLKSLPAGYEYAAYRPGEKTGAAVTMADTGRAERPGAGIYAQYCARCHGADGMGRGQNPALAGNPEVMAGNPLSVIRIVLEGGDTAVTQDFPKARRMPAFKDRLDDRAIADVVSYIRGSWGNHAGAVSERPVSALRRSLKNNPPSPPGGAAQNGAAESGPAGGDDVAPQNDQDAGDAGHRRAHP
jgi:mono/diheme cytochrome c family protein